MSAYGPPGPQKVKAFIKAAKQKYFTVQCKKRAQTKVWKKI